MSGGDRHGGARAYVGTSGWHYGHWSGPFYPADMPAERFLGFYAERFGTVEINNSFYHLPQAETFVHWRDSVPPGFVFAVKASRYITHMKKLKDPETPLANVLGRAALLGDRLGPVLFQLPPHWRLNLERLRAFLQALPEGGRYVFEFREGSWFDSGVYEALAQRGAALCIYNAGGRWTPFEVTAAFVYVRMHGPGHEGHYTTADLADLAESVTGWSESGRDVYCYFNNDQAGYAVRDALELRGMLQG
ncbi:MAG: DUF72 domain-containing protein [Anaerolineae bacterium]